MNEEYPIIYVDKSEWEIIGAGIQDYNIKQAGDDKARSLCFVLMSPDQKVLGGVIGSTYWDWLHIDLMWIKEEFRGRGYGQRLLTLSEDEARQRGAKNVYLDTFDFQAPEFYKRYGYQIFGELLDFLLGHRRYFLTKQL